MKKVVTKKIVYSVLVAIFAIASFCSGISYSLTNSGTDYDEEIVYETPTIYDEDLIIYDDPVLLESFITKEVKEEVKEEPKVVVSKEDPNAAKKKLEAEKGTAKATTVQQSVQKYETNETSLGIDVSYANGKIDWAKVKAAGIKFAIIRVGFRGWGSGKLVVDSRFYDNMKGAIANDISVGVYFFAGAISEEEAREEARFTINLIKDYDISFPVVYDTEYFNDTYKVGDEEYANYRLKNTSDAQLTNNAIAFSETIKAAGYTPMIYASANPLTKRFETARFGDTRIWVAQYNDTLTYTGKHHMWQYTSKGSVPGINGYVDMNVSYFSVTTDASKQSSVTGVMNDNGLAKVDFVDCYYPTTSIKNVTIRSTPYTELPNKAGTLSGGSNIVVTGISDNWIKFTYNNDTFYVNDVNFYNINNDYSSINLTTKTNKEITLLKMPYSSESNIYKKLDIDIDITIIGVNPNYTKVKYDNKIYYVNDVDKFYLDEVKENVVEEESGNSENSNLEETQLVQDNEQSKESSKEVS